MESLVTRRFCRVFCVSGAFALMSVSAVHAQNNEPTVNDLVKHKPAAVPPKKTPPKKTGAGGKPGKQAAVHKPGKQKVKVIVRSDPKQAAELARLKRETAAAQKREEEARSRASIAENQASADREARLAAERKANNLQDAINRTAAPAPEPKRGEPSGAGGAQAAEANLTDAQLTQKAYNSLVHNLLDTANKQARAAIAKNPSSANAHAVLANALLETYMLTFNDATLRDGGAEAAKAYELDNQCALAYNALAFTTWINRDVDKATILVHGASRLAPKLAYIYVMQGCIDTKFEDKEADFKRAIELNPEIAWAHVNLALIYQEQNRPDDADKELLAQKSLSEISYWLGSGEVAFQRKQWDEAEQCYRKAIKLNPDYCAGYAPLAVALLAQGDRDGAREQATIAKQKGIVHHPVYKALGME